MGITSALISINAYVIMALTALIVYYGIKFFTSGTSGGALSTAAKTTAGEVGKIERAREEGEKEEAVDQLEVKEERKIIKTLKDMDKRLDNLIKGKDTTAALKEIENDLLKLSKELKGLKDLEITEKGEEDVRKSLGIQSGKMYNLLANEQSLIVAFDKLINQGISYIKNRQPAPAKAMFNKGRETMKMLIKINRKERRAL